LPGTGPSPDPISIISRELPGGLEELPGGLEEQLEVLLEELLLELLEELPGGLEELLLTQTVPSSLVHQISPHRSNE
jgi:hypothetical protein